MRISLKEQLARAKARLNNTKEHIDLLKLLSMLDIDKNIKIELEEIEEPKGFYMPKYKFYTSSYEHATDVSKLFSVKEHIHTWRLDFSFEFKHPKMSCPPIEIRCREPGWEDNEKHNIIQRACSGFDADGYGPSIYDIKHAKDLKSVIAFYKKLGVKDEPLKKAEGLIRQLRKEFPEGITSIG